MTLSLTAHLMPIKCNVPGCCNTAGFIERQTIPENTVITMFCHACVQHLDMACWDINGANVPDRQSDTIRPLNDILQEANRVHGKYDKDMTRRKSKKKAQEIDPELAAIFYSVVKGE